MLNALYYHIRHNHPIWFFTLVFTATIIIFANIVGITAANTELFDKLGANRAKEKIIAIKEFAFWRFRAWRNEKKHVSPPHKHYYGSLDTANRDGTLNIIVIDQSEYRKMRISLADVIVHDPNALAVIVNLNRNLDVEFDLYETGETYPFTVIWLNGKPFNIQVIVSGVGRPDSNPPTNIVDKAFAEYYLSLILK
jgi:hypothetical protein